MTRPVEVIPVPPIDPPIDPPEIIGPIDPPDIREVGDFRRNRGNS